MTLRDCNPFIRSIKAYTITESTEKTYALNHRLIYFTSGSGSIYIHPNTYPIYKDTAILYPSGLVYEVIVDTPISFLTLNFDYTQNFTHLNVPLELQRVGTGFATPLEEIAFTDFPALNQEIYIPDATSILNDMYTLLDEMQKKKIDRRPFCSGLIKMVICKVLRASANLSKDINPKVENIFSFIHENYASNIDNMQIAAHIGYHPYYVNKLFSTHTGMTIHQYVNHYRLMQAAHYLSTSTIPINEIGEMVGFLTPGHFTGNFKKKFGLSPKHYRDMHNAKKQ
ncbi:MAG: helix-turn-helix transcriptional regulator [Tyzzerella sp.]|nr:helix-turn-helix transcriptional regulator [Tyzzerella sp.]